MDIQLSYTTSCCHCAYLCRNDASLMTTYMEWRGHMTVRSHPLQIFYKVL